MSKHSEKPIDLDQLAKDLMGNLRVNVAADKKRLAESGWNEPACPECSRLASRVEELENLIAKHSGSLNCADSASSTESNRTAKETR